MIRITCLTGHYAGATRIMPPEINPTELFTSLTRHGWSWEVDYTAATEEEKLLWFTAEMVARVLRALNAGLPVRFLDREYRTTGDDLTAVASKLEDDIVSSGRMVTIDSDDEQGLAIGVKGYEFLTE